MGKFQKAILAFKDNKNVIVNGRNTINKVRHFLEKELRVSYGHHPVSLGLEFNLFRKLDDTKIDFINDFLNKK
jgi:hypothetical protein